MPARTARTAKPTTHQTFRVVDSDDGVPRPGTGVVGLAAAGLMDAGLVAAVPGGVTAAVDGGLVPGSLVRVKV
jgi:hypothetical protein